MSSPQKISQLTTAGPLTGAELVPIVQTSGTLQTTVSTIAAFAVVSIVPVVSALGTQIAQVSAIASANTVAIASVEADVSALEIQVAAVSASVAALQIQVNNVSAALTSTNNTVSALEVRVSSVSAAAVSVNAVVSALDTRVADVSALVSSNAAQIAVVSALVSANAAQIAGVSALVSTNTAAITSINSAVSALDVRVSVLEVAVSNIGDVSAIATLVSAVASLESTVSALVVQVADVSALTSVNAASITSINAVVSTKVNRVGDYMDSVQYIEFDTSTSYAVSSGRMTWGIEDGTVDIGLDAGPVVLQTGLQLYQRVYNDTASTITKGTVVKITGSSGQRLTVAPALADSDADSATTFAVMAETVSVNAQGYAMTEGVLKNINTSGIADGAILWLSPTSAGQFTTTKPVAPQHLVLVGFTVKGNSVGGGSIYVKINNGYELGELHDVKVSSSASIANNEVLAYNTSAGVWTNSSVLLDVQASVSALNIQVAAVSALTSANAVAIAAVSASVSVLQIQVNAVSAALTSTNNVVSALEIRVSSASATGVTNAAAITSINNVVSALEIRVSTVSARASANKAQIDAVSVLVSVLDVRITAVSASVSALQVFANAIEVRVSTVSAVAAATKTQVDAVSVLVSAAYVSIGQRVLKAGDTMTGNLNISTSADAQAVSVAGYATFTSRVSISAGFYTGLQNYQDFTVQRPTFRDYGLVVVAKGSVSSAVSLDLTDGNYFEAIAAGSASFVFVSPPVSVAGVAGRAAGGFILELQNGGAATVTWPAAVKWPGGTAPTLTTSGFDVFVFITDDGGTTWRGVQSMKDSK